MTFRLYTLGCKMNAYESEAIREKLLKAGFEEKKELWKEDQEIPAVYKL